MAPDLQKKVDKARAARLAREAAMKGQVDAQVSCIVLVNKVKIQVVFLVILVSFGWPRSIISIVLPSSSFLLLCWSTCADVPISSRWPPNKPQTRRSRSGLILLPKSNSAYVTRNNSITGYSMILQSPGIFHHHYHRNYCTIINDLFFIDLLRPTLVRASYQAKLTPHPETFQALLSTAQITRIDVDKLNQRTCYIYREHVNCMPTIVCRICAGAAEEDRRRAEYVS